MSYTQNNPFSRKSSPLNDDQWIQKATADIKKRGTEGVCTGDKFGSESCPPGSKRYNLAKTFEEIAKNRKGGPSRESSEQPWGGNKDDYKRRDVDGVMKKIGDVDGHYKDYEAPSRKSSSPLNQDERSGHTFLDKVKGTVQNVGSYLSDVPGKLRQRGFGFTDKDYNIDYHAASQQPEFAHENVRLFDESGKQTNSGTYHSKSDAEAARLARNAQERKDRVSEGSAFFRKSSPLNNTGMTGLNYSKELQYMPIEDDMNRGMSRKTNTWEEEDVKEGWKLESEGHYGHAEADFDDAHDSYNWRPGMDTHAERPSRKSRSERLRGRAMKRSERTGTEWGDYDYEDPRVQRMLEKASELDARGGKKMKMTMTKNIRPAKKTMTKSIRPVQKKK